MKKNIVLFLALLLFSIACKTTVKGTNGVEYENAVSYNDYIVNKHTDIIKMIQQFAGESQTDLLKAGQTIEKAVVKVDKTILEIAGMPEWKGNTRLRDTALLLFRFYKRTFAEDYKWIIAMQKDGEITPEEKEKHSRIISRITSMEAKLDAGFKAVQLEFANQNGFQIADSGTQH